MFFIFIEAFEGFFMETWDYCHVYFSLLLQDIKLKLIKKIQFRIKKKKKLTQR